MGIHFFSFIAIKANFTRLNTRKSIVRVNDLRMMVEVIDIFCKK